MQATAHLEALQQKQKAGVLSPALASKRVLAFAPNVLPLRSDGEAGFRAAVMGLVQVSHGRLSHACAARTGHLTGLIC